MAEDRLFRGNYRDFLSADIQGTLQKDTLEKLKPHIVHNEEIERVLDALNFAHIQATFDGDVGRSAHSVPDASTTAHIIARDKIILTNDEGYRAINTKAEGQAGFVLQPDIILVNVDKCRELKELDPDIPFPLLLINVIMHEEGHASSARFADSEGEGRAVFQVGVNQVHMNFDTRDVMTTNRLLDEAIRERRAIEQTVAYVRSHPIPGVTEAHLQRFEDIYTSSHMSTEYFIGIHILSEIEKAIAKDTGVDIAVVRKGFLHAGVEGLNLELKETKMMLDLNSLFGRGFTDELARIRNGPEAFDFVKNYKMNDGDKFMKAMRRYLEKTQKLAPPQSRVVRIPKDISSDQEKK